MRQIHGTLFITVRCFLFPINIPGRVKTCLICLLFLLACNTVAAQTCTVITSIPATPPVTPNADVLVSATDPRYSVENARIYDSFNYGGNGVYTTIPSSNSFWINPSTNTGPLNRCGVWGSLNPKKLGFTECVNIPADASYYIGFSADNRGEVTLDGVGILANIAFSYWNFYKISLTKGMHIFEFSIVNDGGPASIGFEIYNNTKEQIMNAQSYADLNLVFSTKDEIGQPVEEGDPGTTYSCPIGYTLNFCTVTSDVPVCSQFLPVNFDLDFTITNPPPVCLAAGADITSPQVTKGSLQGLTYSYWKDNLATVALDNPNKITTSGTYYIMATANGCSAVKPVTVVVNSTNTTINKTACLGSTYLGHDKSGVYVDTLIATNGCYNIRTLNLTFKPQADTTINVVICSGDSYLGHTKSGTYIDTLTTASGCDSLVTINLTAGLNIDLGSVTQLCLGDSLVLRPGSFKSYLWQDGSSMPYYNVTTGGTYWVNVTNENGCTGSDTIAIKETFCVVSKFPNAFTPNGDGVNDTWNLNGLQSFPQCTVFIYNRWGQLVFKSTGYSKPWDGTYNNKNVPFGTYYYVIDLKNNTPPISGDVTVIR